MSPVEQHELTELGRLQDLALVIEDRDLAEQTMRIIKAVVTVRKLHPVDAKGRCLRCRPAGRRVLWRRRQPCTVCDEFDTTYRVDPRRARPGGEQ